MRHKSKLQKVSHVTLIHTYCLNKVSSRAHDVGVAAVGGGCVWAGVQSVGRWRPLEARRGSPAGAEAGDGLSALLLGHRVRPSGLSPCVPQSGAYTPSGRDL